MKKNLLILLLSAGLLYLGSCGREKTNAEDISMVVGTYTGNGSHGIYSLKFDQENGTFHMVDSLAAVNPSYLIFSDDGTKIYSVNEVENEGAGVSAISFDSGTGIMSLLNGEVTGAGAPCYLTTNGKLLATANYGGGSMSVFPLAADGTLLPMDTLYAGGVGGPDSVRQEAPHVHCVQFSPDGHYLYASDFSADRLLVFKVSEDGTHLTPLKNTAGEEVSVAVDPDYGPRHLIFDETGKHAYVIGELSGTITVFDYDNGNLTPTQVIDADPYDGRGSADIHLSPDGKFLYASNRLKGDGISIFEVDGETGLLKEKGYQLTGLHPRHFNITPNGKYLLVACRDTNEIEIYLRDPATGELSKHKDTLQIPSPVCVQFFAGNN